MTFEIAKKIAFAACELDWLKKVTSHLVASEAQKHIETLHECALELAGNRACEIYTEPYELYVAPAGKNQGEPRGSAQIIEFSAQRTCDRQ